MKSKIRVGRLRRLAKHLRGTHRAHKTFNIKKLATGEFNEGNYCGFTGCAIGEFPEIWPKEWRWTPDTETLWYHMEVIHKSQKVCVTDYKVIAEFFSITYKQVQHLFDRNRQNIEEFGGKTLKEGASAIDVADNINAFIKKVAS